MNENLIYLGLIVGILMSVVGLFALLVKEWKHGILLFVGLSLITLTLFNQRSSVPDLPKEEKIVTVKSAVPIVAIAGVRDSEIKVLLENGETELTKHSKSLKPKEIIKMFEEEEQAYLVTYHIKKDSFIGRKALAFEARHILSKDELPKEVDNFAR